MAIELQANQISLSDPSFWEMPLEDRDRAFDILRREKPVSWQESPVAFAPKNGVRPNGYWAITRHADIRAIHPNTKVFSAAKGTFLFDNMSMEDEYLAAGMMGTDAPVHTKLRGLVQATFTPKTISRMRAQIQRRSLELVAAVSEKGQCDYKEIVNPLPLMTICDLMGFPEEDHNEVGRLVHLVTGATGPDSFDISLQASRDLTRYAIDLSRKRAKDPRDDLLTLLVQAEVDGERLTEADLGAMVHLISVAGADTSAGTLHNALTALDQFPDQRALLLSDFDRYIDTAIEEIVRWASPGAHLRRTALEDVVIGNQLIKAGESVVLWFRSGNRDETAFKEPYKFDITRSPNPHVGFGGGGPHFCLGALLAKLEIKMMLQALLTHIPDIHLTTKANWLPTPQYVLVDGPMPCKFTPKHVDLS